MIDLVLLIARLLFVALLYLFLFAIMRTGIGMVKGSRKKERGWTVSVERGPKELRGVSIAVHGPVIVGRSPGADIVIGAAATVADMSGYGKATHIKDKLNEMIHLAETLYCCSIACSAEGKPTAAGNYYVDPLLANVGKHNVTKLIYDIDRLAQDVGGGILATLPSEADFRSPEVGKYVEKYMRGVASVPTEDRMRMIRLVEVMTGGVALVESMHGAGSPQAQKIMYSKLSGLESKKKAAMKIAGVDPSKYSK